MARELGEQMAAMAVTSSNSQQQQQVLAKKMAGYESAPASPSSFATQHTVGSTFAPSTMSVASVGSTFVDAEHPATFGSTAVHVCGSEPSPVASPAVAPQQQASKTHVNGRPLPTHKLPAHLRPAMSKLPFTERTAHRLVFTSLVLATKQQDDFFWTNKYYGQCGGVDCKSVNEMELAFLRLLEWKSHVTKEVFENQLLEDCKRVMGFETQAEAAARAAAVAVAERNAALSATAASPLAASAVKVFMSGLVSKEYTKVIECAAAGGAAFATVSSLRGGNGNGVPTFGGAGGCCEMHVEMA